MKHFLAEELGVGEVWRLLLGGVAPRPIALVATVSERGEPNLAPFSFFNVFGSNPPYVAFSPSTRGRDGSKKDTYHHLVREKQCTIQAVTYDMVEQVNLASTEYAVGVNEFVKSGLTPIPSDLIRPPRVKESPFQMECVLEQVLALGEGKGAGNLMICRVLKFHVAEEMYGPKGLDPERLDLVGRMGGSYYSRTSGAAVFEVEKPVLEDNIGYPGLPDHIKQSTVLTANDLAQLAGVAALPTEAEVAAFIKEISEPVASDQEEKNWQGLFALYERSGNYEAMLSILLAGRTRGFQLVRERLHRVARVALAGKDLLFAWKAVLIPVPLP